MNPPKRKKYVVKDIVNALKKINATPSVTYDIGNQLVYSQWSACCQKLGDDHPISTSFKRLLDFLQSDYEAMLVRGEYWRTNDTPNAVFNKFLKELPQEFLAYEFDRSPDYIHDLLTRAKKLREAEVEKHKAILANLKKLLDEDPNNPDLWNELRLVLWIIGDYKEASEAFKTARDLGWSGIVSSVVGL